ncbi:uncharacterized protein LOC26530183 [Drosophila willistoni]|uniref:uncharacterized protein LOC26530183 n=1 Tax=Drosophila willistoni TaxID=7260 RepID=UPI000C26CC7B|nr:uncharacterized protein LOC26530183 [Drosophila willistoni]
MFSLGKSFLAFTFLLLLLGCYVCIYQEYFQSACSKPFVQIGRNCYFFSTNKAASYEFYKVSYKNRVFSVPIMMDWLHANFGCETLDSQARLITLQNADEMRLLVDYIRDHTHADTHPMFWSGGHRGRANDGMDIDHRTLIDFYWHDDYFPMNFTNFARDVPLQKTYSDGFCVSLEFTGNELIMGVASCEKRMSFVCELRLL